MAKEALALGKPVVAFDIGGNRGIIGDAGRVVPPGDTSALAAGIVELLLDPHLREEMGAKGKRAAIERYSPERYVEAIEEVYRKALQRRDKRD